MAQRRVTVKATRRDNVIPTRGNELFNIFISLMLAVNKQNVVLSAATKLKKLKKNNTRELC